MTVLIATAVAAEAEAIRAGLGAAPTGDPDRTGIGDPDRTSLGDPDRNDFGDPSADIAPFRLAGVGAGHAHVAAVGVGPAAAAARTARLLAFAEVAGHPYRAVLSAGIGGGFPGRAEVGATVIATRTIAADLGAESPDGFLPIDRLGFGTGTFESDPVLFKALTAVLPAALAGDVLTLATVTGTAETARRLAARHPAALAEAMEGYGVAAAASAAGLPFIEFRTISNPVGPRNRSTWRLHDALSALSEAAKAMAA